MAEVKAVFPAVTQSATEDALAAQGIRACDWNTDAGARTVQVRISDSSVEDEISTFESGVIDPFKPVDLTRVPIAGTNGGIAIVARRDEANGMLQSVAVAAVQVGGRTVTLISSDLAERDDAATALGQLAKTAAARLK